MGSVFTEMVKGATIDEARKITAEMESKLAAAPQKQQACAELVLSAFIAALINRENRIEGSDQELHKIEIERTCNIEEEAKN
ncbi:MAG TPA: hypothetical protein ENL04_04200 [Sulfuricurvum sp.]|nr:hypothetical protein [Sulfuricurvum sp.]